MLFSTIDSFKAKKTLQIADQTYVYFDLPTIASKLGLNLAKLPNCLKILLENLARFEDNKSVKKTDIEAIGQWMKNKRSDHEIAFHPTRVLMQDFTGVPAVVDLAAMRDATKVLGIDPKKINPLIPVDLIVDHSVQADKYGDAKAFAANVHLEMERNKERYEFLKWGQSTFNNFRVVPPGTGICHQVNLEYLAKVVWSKSIGNETYVYPDTLVGTDSHTPMVNGVSVLGWGVGGIEAEAAMLGQPISMVIPEVIGFKLAGHLSEGVTATDLVLTVTELLRKKGVVNKFVEFFGAGLKGLSVADRATISNMSPENGSTCGYFPVDEETIKYLKLTARPNELIELVEQYSKAQGMWRDDNSIMEFSDIIELDLSTIQACLAGPKRPQDKVMLNSVNDNFISSLPNLNKDPDNVNKEFAVQNRDYKLKNGDVVIASITSCTNTSNPSVMIGAGILARNALKRGLKVKPWVKTSLAPGSKVVTEYFEKTGLQDDLNKLGFYLVGYGCTTCIGNSGPLLDEIENTIKQNNLVVTSVLSGNRNFEGRIHSLVRANYLASPMLCVAYALAGTINIDLSRDAIGYDENNQPVLLKDIWPSNQEINDMVSGNVNQNMFIEKYSDVFHGEAEWQSLSVPNSENYNWNNNSTYIKNPPYFDDIKSVSKNTDDIKEARLLALFGDSITTDHISPAGSIAPDSPAAKYLNGHGVERRHFNSYGSRRGNHEVMMRGTFANIRIKNELVPQIEGGFTKYMDNNKPITIYDAAMSYKAEGIPTIIIAGKEYGSGSSRDWAAKGPKLLGVKAIIAESFERIHRSNLVGMGLFPLVFTNNMSRLDLKLTGNETFDIVGLENITPLKLVKCIMKRDNGSTQEFDLKCRVDTEVEVEYIKVGGILNFVLTKLKN